MAADRTLAFALAGIVLVVGLGVLVSIDAVDAFDQVLINAVRDPDLHGGLAFLGPLTHLGSTGAVTIVALLTFAVGAAVGPWRHGLIGAATIGAASLGVELVKALVSRARPDLLEPLIEEHGFSFPSGHSTLSMVAYGVLAVLITRSRLPRRVATLVVIGLGVLVVLIGISRAWLGVHYPTDVIAGWVAGWVVVLGYASLTREVSREPAAGAVDADPVAPRSDPPAAA
ncbi:MAG: phosphatase PAP2 family protein [Chloroflexota bacterium]|nr:phosphatase PAP2 family protein [Chloroflexota bacterium]